MAESTGRSGALGAPMALGIRGRRLCHGLAALIIFISAVTLLAVLIRMNSSDDDALLIERLAACLRND